MSQGTNQITEKYINIYNLVDILKIDSTFQTMWVDTSLLNCEVEAASQLHTQNSCVFPPVFCQNLFH